MSLDSNETTGLSPELFVNIHEHENLLINMVLLFLSLYIVISLLFYSTYIYNLVSNIL